MTAEATVPAPTTHEGSSQESTRAQESYAIPPVDIYEDDQGLVLLADLPGVEPGSVDIRLEQNMLTIQAQARHLVQGEPIYREFQLTGFFREFQMQMEIDPDRVSAELKHGVLTLRLPKAQRLQPRRIEVQAS